VASVVIKARGATPLGVPVVILGLTGENVTRLTAGEPIRFNLSDLGLPPCLVVICYGRTEEAITRDLESHRLLPAGTADEIKARVRDQPPRRR